MSAEVRCEGREVAEATMMLRLMPFPNAELEACMRARAARLGIACAAGVT